MGISMFKRSKPKQFNLKTRYYDPEQEEREKRKRIYERVKGDYEYNPEELREELQYRWGLHRESKLEFNKKTTSLNRLLMLVLITAVIIAILVYMKFA
jgi:hypothetical protein